MRTSYRNTKSFLIFILLYGITSQVFSQDYSYINYDTRDGLAGSIVYDAIQDKEGFMWFATENGLSRFDGKNFKTFTTKDGLPDNEILKLFIDSKGRVWIMPFRPSICYYFKGKIYNKSNDSILAKIPLVNRASDMVEDIWGNLIIGEEKAWHSIFTNGVVKTCDVIDSRPIAIYALGLDTRGEAKLLATVFESKSTLGPASFRIIYPLKNKIEEVKNGPYGVSATRSQITPEYVFIPGKSDSRLILYRDSTDISSAEIPINTVSVSYVSHNLIINTTTGIRFLRMQTRTLSQSIFNNFSITSSYEDKESNLWLTTLGAGVIMIPSFQFRNFSLSDQKKFQEITALFRSNDTVYAGGLENVWRINARTLAVDPIVSPLPGKLISIVPINNKPFFISSTNTENPFNSSVKHVQGLTLKFASIGKSGIIFASHKNALLCTPSGKEEIIWEQRTTCAIEKDSGFYIGTLSGLFYKSYSGKIVNVGGVFPQLSSRIVKLAISDGGILWIATKGDGIVGYSNGRLLYHFTQTEGLTSDNCNSLYIDGNVIWVGTEKGLNRIDVSRRNKITHFSMSDGLPSNTINAIAADGNKVFVGTPSGLTYFEVDKISQTSTCDLQLTGIYVANKYWCYDSTNFSLPHKNNDIRFEFSGISFKSAGEMTYKYRVLGLQPEWRTTTEKQLSFPSLSSGAYTLQLKVINKYGVESKTKEVSFVIEKLLWQKTWFKVIMATLLAFGIWLFVTYRIKQIRRTEKDKAEISNRIAELEQKALRSQMNPHFIFNCLNSIQQYVAERDITGANNFITDFSRLIRMTLDLSTHSLISLGDELQYISTYLRVEKARLEGTFDYRLNVDETLNLHAVYLPPLLLQPYLENSIRHGIRYKREGDGLIQININKRNDGVLIQIEDNGIGRRASKKYKSEYHIQYQSRGMTINEDRIKMLNHSAEKTIELTVIDLYNLNEEAAGTRVDVYLPS
jgi:ligand-binding sensor domain-containing protein